MLSAKTWWKFPVHLRLKDWESIDLLCQEDDVENMVGEPWDLEDSSWIKLTLSRCVR
jgi:hypothetical protein